MTAAEAGYVDETRLIRKIAFRIMPLIIVCYFFAYIDRINVGFAALEMNADLGLTPAAYGFGAGIFFLGYVLCEVPSNLILARVGARKWICRIMVSWGLLSASTAFVWDATSFIVVRFLLGVAEAGFFPGVIFYLMAWIPVDRRAVYFGLLLATGVVAAIIGAPLSGLILAMNDFAGLRSWQWLFVLQALPSVLLGFCVLKWLPDTPETQPWLSDREKTWLRTTLEAEANAKAGLHEQTIHAALLSPSVWGVGAMILPTGCVIYTLFMWLPQLIAGFGLSKVEAGAATAVPFLFAAISMIFWARHSDRTGERTGHIVIASAVCIAGLLLAGLTDNRIAVLTAITLTSIGVFSTLAVIMTLAPALLDGRAAAAGVALAVSIGNIGSFVGPYLVGWIVERTGSFHAAFLLFAALMLITPLLAASLQPGGKRERRAVERG